ncbi:transposase [uncultured Dokdonia sp.]|uniref:transposase n=1 Tax=unclassified Dokdonia TaxID=2615033 RepID=UPI00260C2054|nr:transposase [uncultured Dokdonia sp.]
MTPKRYNRQSRRLKGYDYSNKGRYFITIVTKNRLRLFGKISNGQMKLNAFGEIARREWLKTIEMRTNISLGEYIIMPDHIHLVFHIEEKIEQPNFLQKELERISGAVQGKHKIKHHSVSTVIRGYKAAITNQVKQFIHSLDTRDIEPLVPEPDHQVLGSVDLSKSIWVRGYHDIIIPNDRAYDNISQYVKDNPKKWDKK